MTKKQTAGKRTRFAIYTRYSSELQNDLSLEAQEQRCREEIAKRNGVVVGVYSDGAKSGWSLDRDGFNELRRAAEKGRFDAIMFWKFDRLARNHDHVVMIKILLRTEYRLKLYCVEGFSEDEDDSPYTAMMEQMLAIFSAFYSRNLSNETKRGKRQRVLNGMYNGSIAPLGYDLVTKRQATPERPSGLHINLAQAKIVMELFRLYATGTHSDATLSRWLNRQPVIQELRRGKKPYGKDTVRDILKNRLYTGRVPYAETIYNGSLGQSRRASRNRRQWFEGKHEAIISDDLYDRCQQVRKDLTIVRKPPATIRTYVLHDRTYCARCVAAKPTDSVDERIGKMRPVFNNKRGYGLYRCIAHNRGYRRCEQPSIRIAAVDEQVIQELSNLSIPDGFRERVEEAVRSKVENEEALKRMQEIEEIVKRIDFSWEQGYLTPQEYTVKRDKLEKEIAALRPVDYDDLMEAADLLENFNTYWAKCDDVDKPEQARKQLLAKIVDKVFVWDDLVIAIALHGDFSVVLDNAVLAPSEVVQSLKKKLDTDSDEICVQYGNDGDRTRDLRLDRPAC